MIHLNEHFPAETQWICSYLNNKERLQFGLSNKGLYKLLQPLFESIAENAKCQELSKKELPPTDFLSSSWLMEEEICSYNDAQIRERYETREKIREDCRFAQSWKQHNENQLTYHYNPYMIDYDQAKKRVTEKLEVEKICGGFTIEEAIRIAIEKNTIPTSKFELLCRHVNDINQQDSKGNTFLHLALKQNREMLVYTLLKLKAKCNISNSMGETPLHFAALLDTDNMVGALLKNKARINAKDHQGKTALNWAKSKDCIHFLKTKGAI